MKRVCQIFITDLLDINDYKRLSQSASARILAAEKQENIGDVCAGMPVEDARRVVYKTVHKSMKQGLSKFAV